MVDNDTADRISSPQLELVEMEKDNRGLMYAPEWPTCATCGLTAPDVVQPVDGDDKPNGPAHCPIGERCEKVKARLPLGGPQWPGKPDTAARQFVTVVAIRPNAMGPVSA